MSRSYFVIALSMLCNPQFVFGGQLLEKDVKQAILAFQKLNLDDWKQYKLDEKSSGCYFDSCTSLVKRSAEFSTMTATSDSDVLRKKVVDCYAAPGKDVWTCHGTPSHMAKVASFGQAFFYLDPDIDDKTVLALLRFSRTSCASKNSFQGNKIQMMQKFIAEPSSLRYEPKEGTYELGLQSTLCYRYYWHIRKIENDECDFEVTVARTAIVN